MELAIDKEGEQAILSGARAVNLSLGEFVKEAVLDRLDEIEAEKSARAFLEREANGDVEFSTSDEVAKELGF